MSTLNNCNAPKQLNYTKQAILANCCSAAQRTAYALLPAAAALAQQPPHQLGHFAHF